MNSLEKSGTDSSKMYIGNWKKILLLEYWMSLIYFEIKNKYCHAAISTCFLSYYLLSNNSNNDNNKGETLLLHLA